MKTKRLIAWALSCLMVCGLAFTGCSNTPTESKSDSGTSGNNTSSTSEPANFNAEGMPIVNDKVTETLFGCKHPIHGDWSKMVFFEEMESKTNIAFEFDTPALEVFQDQKNLAFASDQYAGVFLGAMLTTQEMVKYGADQEILLPLEDLIDKYCPNITQMFKDHPEVKASVTATDGHIYAIPQYTVAPIAMIGSGWVDYKWMEKISMTNDQLPTTVEDLYTMLTKLKDAGCKYPFSVGDDGEHGASLYTNILPAFGIPARDFYVDESGKIQYGLAQSNAVEFFKYVQKLYSEKLLDPDTFTQGYAEMAAKGSNGDIGLAFHAIPTLIYGSSLTNEEAAKYPVLPALGSAVTGGKQMARQTSTGITQGTFALTQNCKNVEAMMRWVDYLYTEEGSMLIHYGPENLGWKTNSDGVYEQIMPTDGRSYEERRGGSITPDCGIPCPKFVRAKTEGNWSDPLQQTRVKQIDEKVWPYHYLPLPDMFMTTDEQKVLDTYSTDLNKYIIEQGAKYMTGDSDVANYQSFIDGLKSMHLDDMIATYQTAYDRWTANQK